MMNVNKLRFAALIIGTTLCAAATAQTAGTLMLKGGYNHFYPQVKSEDITGVPGGQIGAGSAGQVFGGITYMLTDHISTEASVGVPPTFDIYGAGSIAAAGKIASADILPPAFTLQYRFGEAKSVFRPYLGLGVVRAMFRNVKGTPVLTALTNPGGPSTEVSIDSVWGVAAQAGFTYELTDKWFIDGAIVPTLINTTARLSTGQTVAVKLNPVGVNLAIGYRF